MAVQTPSLPLRDDWSQESVSVSASLSTTVSALPYVTWTPTPTGNAPITKISPYSVCDTIADDDSKQNIENIDNIVDDINYNKFDGQFAYKKNTKNTKSVVKIRSIMHSSRASSANQLCFKQTPIKHKRDLKIVKNEYRALKRWYQATNIENIDSMVSLYLNKRKWNDKLPCSARLVMRYHSGEDLDDYLYNEEDGEVGFLYENDFITIIKKILLQLNTLHSANVLHCDLKPSNIVIDERSDKYHEDDPEYYDVHICDFGHSEIVNDKEKCVKLNVVKGSPGFIAPETIKHRKYSQKSDMFSLGCVMYFLITNDFAVKQSKLMDASEMLPDRKKIRFMLKKENEKNRDKDSKMKKETIDFVLQCLWSNPKKRPTAKEALNLDIFK